MKLTAAMTRLMHELMCSGALVWGEGEGRWEGMTRKMHPAGRIGHARPAADSLPTMRDTREATMSTTRNGRTRSRRGRRWTVLHDPVWEYERARHLGEMLRMTASTQKAIALTLGKSPGWISRLINNAEPTFARYLEAVERLALSSATDAGPLAVAPLAIRLRVQAEKLSDRELPRAIRVAVQEETDRQGIEDSREARLSLLLNDEAASEEEVADAEDALWEALVESVSIQVTLIGLLWERRRRRGSG